MKIDKRHLTFLVFICGIIVVALALPFLPEKLAYVVIAAVPAVIVAAYILRNPVLGIYIYFILEFLRPSDFFPALSALRLPMIVEIITLVSWIFYLIKSKTKIKWDNFNWLYVGFIGTIGATVVFAYNPRYVFNTFQAMAVSLIIFIMATNLLNSLPRVKKLILILLLIHVYYALKGIYNFAVVGFVSAGMQTSGVVGSSFMSDENDYALALNFMIPFAFFMVSYARNRIEKYGGLAMLLILVPGVLISMSRGGWLGLVSIIILCLIKSKRKLVSFGLVFLLGITIFTLAPKNYWARIATISETGEGTAHSRILYWQAGVKMLKDNPILGVGAGNGPIRMPEYINSVGWRDSATQWGRTFHGTFPQVMGELGTIGLFLYLAMIIVMFKYMVRVERIKAPDDGDAMIIAHSIFISIIGYIVTATFLSTAYYPQLWTLYTIGIILVFWSRTLKGNEIKIKAMPTLTGKSLDPNGFQQA